MHQQSSLRNINQVERKSITRLLCIDTAFRSNYLNSKSTNFLYILPEPMNNVTSLRLSAIEIPNMWYSFSTEEHTNTFTVTIYNCPKYDKSTIKYPLLRDEEGNVLLFTYVHVIKIPDGNYTSDTFETMINALCVNTGEGLEFLIFKVKTSTSKTSIYVDSSAYRDSDGELIFDDANSDKRFRFTIDFSVDVLNFPFQKTAGWMMGFREIKYNINYNNVYYDLTAVGNETTETRYFLNSESSYGSSIMHYIFLEIDDYQRNFTPDTIISAKADTTFIGKNILARISISANENTIILDNGADLIFKKRNYFGPVKLEKLQIRLVDRCGDVINLNSNDYSFALEIEQVYSF